jgi:hypothetical protein
MKHPTHVQPIKTGKFGADLSAKDMQNNPFRAAIQDGHGLNESYKLPVPNSSGMNLSYHNPIGNAPAQHKANAKPPMIKDAKNTY